jgi:hypothetical protein
MLEHLEVLKMLFEQDLVLTLLLDLFLALLENLVELWREKWICSLEFHTIECRLGFFIFIVT